MSWGVLRRRLITKVILVTGHMVGSFARPTLSPSDRACFRSQSRSQAGAWLTAILTDAGTLPRSRLRLPHWRIRCVVVPGWLAMGWSSMSSATMLLRVLFLPAAALIQQAWVRVVNRAWVAAGDRLRLDFVLYGATRLGDSLCCDVTLVPPVRRNGHPHPRAAEHEVARRRMRVQARSPLL